MFLIYIYHFSHIFLDMYISYIMKTTGIEENSVLLNWNDEVNQLIQQ